MYFVFSTLTNGTTYAIYRKVPADLVGSTPIADRKIAINGGSNVAPLPQFGIVTPKGVMTEVSDEDMELLLQDFHFNEHVKHGFITFEQKPMAVEKAIEGMEKKDLSAPKTPEDFEKVEKDDGRDAYKEKGSKRK